MRILTLQKTGEWILPVGLGGEEFKKFKDDYKLIISESSKPASFDLDDLPELSDSYSELKKFMSFAKTIEDWNFKRELAKRRFTFPVLVRLDHSGFINKVLK